MPRYEEVFRAPPFHWFLQPGQPGCTMPPALALEEYAPIMQRVREGSLALALTYGVAIGSVEIDKPDPLVYRSHKWHILALLVPPAVPPRDLHLQWVGGHFGRASQVQVGVSFDLQQLRERYGGCEVRGAVTRFACRAVQRRWESHLSSHEIDDLANRPAELIRPSQVTADGESRTLISG